MKTLIKLELKKNKISTYVIASLVIAITMLGLLYLLAYVPMLEPNDKDMAIFMGYNNLIPMNCVLNMTAFSVMAAVIYSKFVIEDYTGKRLILLFSYPVSRKKMLLSKIGIVSGFTFIAMFISNIAGFVIFSITEKFMHLVSEDFTFSVMLKVIEITFVMTLIAVSIGLVSVAIGFIKKSVPTTIISAVLISSLMCNIVVSTASSRMVMYTFAAMMLFIGSIFSLFLINKINVMEVQ